MKYENQSGGAAFPNDPKTYDEGRGMTLRDYFAAKAMAGLLAHPESDMHENDELARQAFNIADAMLEARK